MRAVAFQPRGPLFRFGLGLGQVLPSLEEVLTTPRPGTFYQVKKGDLPIRIASTAYGDAQKKAGLLTINRSTWNDRIRKARTGWEVYKVDGFQLQAKYSGPRTTYGSGSRFPVLWIPPSATEGGEPVAAPAPPAPTPPAPAPAPKPAPEGPKTPTPPAPSPPPAKDSRYRPLPEEVLTTPRPGTFYQSKKGDLAIRIASTAYGSAAQKAGLLTINRSTWNDRIRKARTGWEVYKVDGFQLQAKYSGPRTAYGSGSRFPVLWIPPSATQGGEPEATAPPTPPAPTPPPKPKPPTPTPTPKPPKPPTPTPTPAPPATNGRYLPLPEEVLTKPRPGTFYQVKKGDLPIRIASTAYGSAAQKAGLLTINRSTWNDRIRKARTGWEVYKVDGFQLQAKYSGPRTAYGSGSRFPVLWIPPSATQGGEPEATQPPKPPEPKPPEPQPPEPQPYKPEPEPQPEPQPEPPITGQPFPCSCPACGRVFMCSGTPWIPPHFPPCPFTGHPWDYKPQPPEPQPPEPQPPEPQPPEPQPPEPVPPPKPKKKGDVVTTALTLLTLARLARIGE